MLFIITQDTDMMRTTFSLKLSCHWPIKAVLRTESMGLSPLWWTVAQALMRQISLKAI